LKFFLVTEFDEGHMRTVEFIDFSHRESLSKIRGIVEDEVDIPEIQRSAWAPKKTGKLRIFQALYLPSLVH
jgi:hypothetical protein